MNKHTAGPWHVGTRKGANSNTVWAYNGGNDQYKDQSICSVYGLYQNCSIEEQKDGEGLANARLIAAAPELLEALELALKGLEAGAEIAEGAGKYKTWQAYVLSINTVRAAIAKARGRQ